MKRLIVRKKLDVIILPGAGLGALIAVGFVVASEVSNAAFRMTKPVVILIDAGYRLLFLAGAGALIGGWR